MPHPDAEPGKLVRDRGCRWEVVGGAPWRDGASVGPAPASPLAVTLLLDQCSGRTWTLAFSPAGFEWRPVRGDPDWAVVLERP